MSADVFSLHGKTALVIGAVHAIGQALAHALAEAGARVAIASTRKTSQEASTLHVCFTALAAQGGASFAQVCDATREDEMHTLIQRTLTELGSLDILINAPDLPFAKPLPAVSLKEWERVLTVNLTSVYLACRAASEPMLTRQYGRIINVVSLLGERGMANGSAYCAAQAGVLNLTRALALEWAQSGITVNALGAGWTEGMGMIAEEPLRQQLIRYLPTKRLAHPHEIAEAVVYLASDTTGFLTGQTLWVDGGALSHL